MVQATHQGTLRIGTTEIPCFVLKDGTRLVSARGLAKSLGTSHHTVVGRNGSFLSKICRNSQEDNAPTVGSVVTVDFTPPHGGRSATGFSAAAVTHVIRSVLAARRRGELAGPVAHKIADHCEILLTGFAEVGLTALIDEATGYQEIRGKSALQQLLDRYLAKELSQWAKTFPDRFYQEMHRLKGWEYDATTTRRPGCVAHYTVDLIYDRLAPDLVAELRKMAPAGPSGHRSARLHQGLSSDFGQPRLQMHLFGIMTLMAASRSWEGFMLSVNRSFPKLGDTAMFPFFAEDVE